MRRGLSARSLSLLVFSCVSLLAARAGASPILIDDFSNSGPPDLSASLTSMPNSGGVIFPGGASGQFSFVGSSAPGDVFVELRYTSLGGLNLSTLNDALGVDVLSVVPFGGDVGLIVTAISGMVTETADVAPISTGPNLLPYAAFTGGGAVFSDLSELRFRFQSPDAFAITIDSIQAVPEPSTAMLLGLGLAGLWIVGRRPVA